MMDFGSLPKKEKEYAIRTLGLSSREEQILMLRYVYEMDYASIAGEMNMSRSSVGRSLTRAREHAVDIAKHLYPIADDRLKVIIDTVGWLDLDWPVTSSRRNK